MTPPDSAPTAPSRRRALAALLAALSIAVAPGAQAGILRDVLAKVGIGKPTEPPVGANGGPPVFPRSGFTCCNLHYDGDTVSDSNHSELPMLAAGTPVTVLGYSKNRATLDVNGRNMRLDHENGRAQETLDTWVNKLVVADDPRPRIGGYPANVQAAIKAGKVVLGMTREQAIVAVGYPLTNENKSLDDAVWRLWHSRRGEYQLNFGVDGRVTTVTGDADVTSQVIYLPSRK